MIYAYYPRYYNVKRGLVMAGKKRSQALRNQKLVTFSKLYNDFIRDRKVRGLSEHSITFYGNALKNLETFLDENGIKDMRAISKEDIEDYTLWLIDRFENKTSINTTLRAARVFLYYAMREDIIDDFKIRLIRDDEIKAKKTYTNEEIQKLMKPPNLKTCSFAEYRSYVLVQVFLDTGIRLNTARNIKVEDVDLESGMIVLRTVKNRRQQVFPLSRTLIEILHHYLTTWEFEKDEYLFPTVYGTQLSANGMRSSIVKYNTERGIQNHSIHSFRHTFAKNYVMTNGNAFKLQRLLGHSTLDTTNTYISLYGYDLAQDFEQHSIIERYTKKNKKKRRRDK